MVCGPSFVLLQQALQILGLRLAGAGCWEGIEGFENLAALRLDMIGYPQR